MSYLHEEYYIFPNLPHLQTPAPTVEEMDRISFSGFPKETFPVTNLTDWAPGYSLVAMLLLYANNTKFNL